MPNTMFFVVSNSRETSISKNPTNTSLHSALLSSFVDDRRLVVRGVRGRCGCGVCQRRTGVASAVVVVVAADSGSGSEDVCRKVVASERK